MHNGFRKVELLELEDSKKVSAQYLDVTQLIRTPVKNSEEVMHHAEKEIYVTKAAKHQCTPQEIIAKVLNCSIKA